MRSSASADVPHPSSPPDGPFTPTELHLPLVDRWTPLRLLLLYPFTAAAVWLALLPCVCLVHLSLRAFDYLSSLLSSSPKSAPSASPPPLSSTLSLSSLSLPPTLPLHPPDAVWLFSSPYHQNVITAVLLLDSPLPLSLLLSRVSTHILPHPGLERLRYLPSSSLNCWLRDDNFDVKNHVVAWPHWKEGRTDIGLDPPSPSATDDWGEVECSRVLLALVGELINQPVQRVGGGPATWSFSLLPHYGEGCVVVFRAHHSLADGVLLSGVLLELLMDSPQPPSPPPEVGTSSEVARLTATMDGRGWGWKRVKEGLVFLGSVCLTLFMGPWQVLRLSVDEDDCNPFHTADGLVSPHKSVGWSFHPIALHRVKRISRFYHCSVNDVMMAVLVSALQRLVEARGMTAGSRWSQRVMHFVVPINIRPLVLPPSAPLTLGNIFSVLILPFPLYAESPRARLLAMTRQMTALKRSVLPLMIFIALHLAVTLLPPFMSYSFIARYMELCTSVITNNRSPDTRLSLCGRELRSWVSWAPCGGSMGMSLTVMSYAGEMKVSVVVDKECGVEGAEIISVYEEEMKRLEDSVPTHFMKEGARQGTQ